MVYDIVCLYYDIVCQPTISYVDIRYRRVPRIQTHDDSDGRRPPEGPGAASLRPGPWQPANPAGESGPSQAAQDVPT